MTPKEIGRAADALFHSILPANWAIRDQQDQEDYGIDYEVEPMKPGDQASGVIFKVQQKGSLHLDLNAPGDQIVFSNLKVERVRYYLQQIRIPAVFILVDVISKEVFWLPLQGNKEVEAAFREAADKRQVTMTVYIPCRNKLPETRDAMLEAVSRCQDAVNVRYLSEVASSRVLEAAINTLDFEKALNATRSHADILRLERVERLLQAEAIEAALTECKRIWSSPSETIEMRFSAAINLLRLTGMAQIKAGTANSMQEYLRMRLSTMSDLVRLTRGSATDRLRVYARFHNRLAQLAGLAEKFHAQAQSQQVQAEWGGGLPFVHWLAQMHKQQLQIRILRELSRAQHALALLVRRGHLRLSAQAWPWLSMEMAPFINWLRLDGQDDVAERLVQWFDQTLQVASDIALRVNDWRSLAFCALQHVTLARKRDREAVESRVKRANALLALVEDSQYREESLAELRRLREEWLREPRLITIEDAQEAARGRALAMGVPLDDENGAFSQIVSIGIRDMNPERVLKGCQHFYVSLGTYGVPAQMLGIPTAGSKWLHCTKFNYSMVGMSLDETHDLFAQEFCANCRECKPHPEGWIWIPEWQEEQDKMYGEWAKEQTES